jgi:hypothetical protein
MAGRGNGSFLKVTASDPEKVTVYHHANVLLGALYRSYHDQELQARHSREL